MPLILEQPSNIVNELEQRKVINKLIDERIAVYTRDHQVNQMLESSPKCDPHRYVITLPRLLRNSRCLIMLEFFIFIVIFQFCTAECYQQTSKLPYLQSWGITTTQEQIPANKRVWSIQKSILLRSGPPI